MLNHALGDFAGALRCYLQALDLAVAVGEESETVETVCEPFLVRAGLLARTPRGRVATPAAWAHLGLRPPVGSTPVLPFTDLDPVEDPADTVGA